jgi:hypothetical protein
MPHRPALAIVLATALFGAGGVAALPSQRPVGMAPILTSSPLALARCLWAALPATTRARLVASGPSIDDIGKAISNMNPALMQLAQSQCPRATNQTESAAKDAWAGTVMTNWAEGELNARYHVTPTALGQAWSRVPPATRRRIAAGFDETPEAVRGNVGAFAADLGLADPPALDLLSAWAIAQLKLAALN